MIFGHIALGKEEHALRGWCGEDCLQRGLQTAGSANGDGNAAWCMSKIFLVCGKRTVQSKATQDAGGEECSQESPRYESHFPSQWHREIWALDK
ncbi:uncharacterized protein SPSK_10932 [Sporothrix schenckii 1099-18]|uniref:Uncharacterized protein n=1 Tax=Sporothrix schenckii 1099-18 TaxID=1397361 RepID=A0A0F2M9J0_SPOSC|nr:uncharacterized protein SPSK_10932 [Sporothrix schenckii 1099-18]KJR85754.1 hypothetical protein SPSK_10932 [Sporothrix schenckii 1099-18]